MSRDLAQTRMIVIGCSAGGVEALKRVLPAIKRHNLSVAVVIHLPHDSETILPELFNGTCELKVKEAEDKEPIEAGTIYFAPPDYHLLVEPDGTFSLSVDDEVNFSRPSIDVLFESAAEAYHAELLGIVLTGANSDGALGLKRIVERGGTGVAQNPASAEYATMPEEAIKAADPQCIMTLEEIGEWLSSWRN